MTASAAGARGETPHRAGEAMRASTWPELDDYQAAMLASGRRLSTWWTYATHLRRLAATFPAGPASVRPSDLSHWLASYAELADDTRRNAATAARAFYAWAYEVGLVETDPAARLAGRRVRPQDGFPKRWRPLIGRYVEAAKVGERTLRIRLGYLRRFAIDQPDPWEPPPEALAAWVAGHAGESAQNGARQALRSLYGYAHAAGLSDADPAATALPRLLNGHQVRRLSAAWRAALDDFATYQAAAGVRPSTVRVRRAHLGALARQHLHPGTVTERDLLNWLARPDWAAETRKSAATSARAFFGWAHRTGLVDQNPSDHLPRVRVPYGRPRPTPTSVLDQALTAATDRDWLMLLLASHAGLRRAEIAAVHPRDFIDGVLHVTGKGGQQRIVPAHPIIVEHVEAELGRRRSGRTGTGWRIAAERVDVDDYLFPGQHPGSHVQPCVVGDALAGLLGDGWTAHSLRHRFASRAYAATRDLRAVQELLGHSSPQTTARYTAVPDNAMREAVLAL